MGSFPDRIAADDLLLRPMAAGDLPQVARQLGDPGIARWMAAIRLPFGPAEAEEILALGRDPAQRLRVIERDGAVIGCLRLCPDLWFWLDPPAQGKGIMARALHLAITAHFAHAVPPLLASCRDDNTASRALLGRLGFARMASPRRMFFHAEGAARPCHDHVMAPEQWRLIHPPVIARGTLTLRPATQKDAPALMPILPRAGDPGGGPWPQPDALAAFIERHRHRAPGQGLWVLEDRHRRVIGMALAGPGAPLSRFLTAEDAARHGPDLGDVLP